MVAAGACDAAEDAPNGGGGRVRCVAAVLSGGPTGRAMTSTAVPQQPYPGLRPFEEGDHAIFFGREVQIVSVLALLEEKPFVAIVGSSGSGKSSLIRAGVIPAVREGFLRGALDWKIIVMKPGSDPLGNLARALMAGGVLETQAVLPRVGAETAFASSRAANAADMLVERLQAADRSLIDLMPTRVLAPRLELASAEVKNFQAASPSSSETILPEHDSAGPPILLVVDQFEELFHLQACRIQC